LSRVIAIGDIHGRLDLLTLLLDKLKITDEDTVIFLGNYIDRGKESKKVVELLMSHQR